MDGVLFDTEPLYREAAAIAGTDFGYVLPTSLAKFERAVCGSSRQTNHRIFQADLKSAISPSRETLRAIKNTVKSSIFPSCLDYYWFNLDSFASLLHLARSDHM
jgi:beta-phosphoglucomutase-like phosphatase (HAD superfamily)